MNLFGILLCIYLLYHYYGYMQDVENYKRQRRMPQPGNKSISKPNLFKIKKQIL